MRRAARPGQSRVQETWNSFWGDLLFRRFHEENPERWSVREQKADWLVETLALPRGARIVDLGCGDGVLDICLAKKGYRVTAVDRIASVLEAAEAEAVAHGVGITFVVADLRTYHFGPPNFGAAIFFDTLGLLGRHVESNVLSRLHHALRPGAHLAIDWPSEGTTSDWRRAFPDGVLKVSAEYDQRTRLQTILPEFHCTDGRIVQLHDPYSLPDHLGIRRYIYTVEEAQTLLDEAGYESQIMPHCRSDDYHMLLASPRR